MEIVRNADGTLVVPVQDSRPREADEPTEASDTDSGIEATPAQPGPATRVLHPGEGGYDEALAEWDLQQNPGRESAVSTPGGRQDAMTLLHDVATQPDAEVASALEALDDPEATGEALRHVLVGGAPSVEGFAQEIAEAEGGDQMPAHQATKIIGEVLTELED